MDERETAAWAAVEAWWRGEGWPGGCERVALEVERDTEAEVRTASTRPIHRHTGRSKIIFVDGTETPWRYVPGIVPGATAGAPS